MNIQNIIEKVRKLRALATSDNVNEAAAAAAAAERLIQEHALSEVQLVEEAERPVDGGSLMSFGSRTPRWMSGLLAGLAKQYRCACWIDARMGEKTFRAVGTPSDLEILRYQSAYFTSEITRLAERQGKGKGKTWRNSFCLGAVTAVLEAMREANTQARAAATSSALVRVDQAAADALAFRDSLVPNLRAQSASRRRIDFNAYTAGKKAGANLNQRTQLSGTGARLLGA